MLEMIRLPAQPVRPGRTLAGFTLVELMISIAIALVLIVGVNAVFRMASDTVGIGNALSAVQGSHRGVQSIIFDDFKGAVTKDPPFFIIRSEATAAFRNAADAATDHDYDPTVTTLVKALQQIRSVDLDGNGKENDPGEQLPVTAVNYRSHRIDQIRFFARGNFPRQTGNNGSLTSNMSSSEALIWYGHVTQPQNMQDNRPKTDPGNRARKPGPEMPDAAVGVETATSNTNNFYASQWILGRYAMLLKEPQAEGNSFVIRERPGVGGAGNPTQYYVAHLGNPGTSLSPLSYKSKTSLTGNGAASETGQPSPVEVQDARYDLAGTSISGFRRIFSDWWPNATAGARLDWADSTLSYRYLAYPYPARPITAAGAARTVPAFLPGCTQFIVEYAGDFLTQDADGVVQDVRPDGTIDFFLQPDNPSLLPIPKPANRNRWSRNIRWYGFPRDTNGDGIIQGNLDSNNRMPDVVPLRDIARTSVAGYGDAGLPFEKNMVKWLPLKNDYAQPGAVADNARYVCGWGDPTTVGQPLPKMIRLTVALDDPNARLAESQTYEYVVELP